MLFAYFDNTHLVFLSLSEKPQSFILKGLFLQGIIMQYYLTNSCFVIQYWRLNYYTN